VAVARGDRVAGRSLAPSPAFLARRRLVERLSRAALFAAASVSVFVTAGIVWVLVSESSGFFRNVSFVEFLTDTEWTPLFAIPRYGILPLLAGTITVATIALLVAIPCGTVLALYLSEFAPHRMREVVKPFLELLEGVPTVV